MPAPGIDVDLPGFETAASVLDYVASAPAPKPVIPIDPVSIVTVDKFAPQTPPTLLDAVLNAKEGVN